MNFQARIKYDPQKKSGAFDFGSDYAARRFKEFARTNIGMRIDIKPHIPESGKMRRWFEGAVIPMVVYFQENMDHRNSEDRHNVREWLKHEFNGDFVRIGRVTHKVAKSTLGELNSFCERVLDWMGEQGYPIELLNPSDYKKWHDEIFPLGGQDNYISYLEECGKIRSTRTIHSDMHR